MDIGEHLNIIAAPLSSVSELQAQLGLTRRPLSRVVILNLDSREIAWQSTMKALKEDSVWRMVPIMGMASFSNRLRP